MAAEKSTPKPRKRKHEDTSISLHPLTFEDALAALVEVPKPADRKTRAAAVA